MPLIITPTTSSSDDLRNNVINSFKVNIFSNEKKSLVIVSPNTIHFYDIDADESSSHELDEPIERLKFHDRVIACSHILPSENLCEWLLVLIETNILYVVAYNANAASFTIIQTFQFRDTISNQGNPEEVGIRKIVSVKPIISVDPTQTFILVYSCQNFLTILKLNSDKKDLFEKAIINRDTYKGKRNTRKRSNFLLDDIFSEPSIINIGSGLVKSITFCNAQYNSENPCFGIVTRGISLNEYLEFFQIQITGNNAIDATSVRKFSPMESESSLVIPISKVGLLVLCAKHEYFYLTPNFKAISNDRGVTANRAFLRRAKLSHSDGLLEEFKSYCSINEHKLLLFNFHGESYVFSFNHTITTDESDIPIEGPTVGILLVEKWETKLIDEDVYSVSPNWLFKLEGKKFIGITDFFQVSLFDLNTGPPATILHHGGQKPITCISGVHNHHITYGSGDISGSEIVYDDNTYTVSHDGVLKKFIEIEHRSLGKLFVTLTESQNSRIDLSEVTCLNKIEVFDSNLNSITSYEFEDDVFIRRR
ncbi:unnamed protein product [Ambrosiozyma monospora]|uniref:Unnamed protein product n=1 Tax=Ambrosiozyma monospora TaxID=43982 RepID=A0A9W6YU04_AMBMO|nr:unnamed protein product [Ambrosiozyma monospora]